MTLRAMHGQSKLVILVSQARPQFTRRALSIKALRVNCCGLACETTGDPYSLPWPDRYFPTGRLSLGEGAYILQAPDKRPGRKYSGPERSGH